MRNKSRFSYWFELPVSIIYIRNNGGIIWAHLVAGVLISMLTVTSAGQLAGIGIMILPGQYIQMLVSQLRINVRYSFMSISIGQKTDSKFKGIWKWILGFMMTDEIFAVASQEDSVSRSFFAGLSVLPYLGWSLGTLLGAILGNILPDRLMSALSIAIYGMFVAIVVPEMKKSKPVILVVVLAIVFSCMFRYIPLLAKVLGGISIIFPRSRYGFWDFIFLNSFIPNYIYIKLI